jgi:hypothetical protein
MAVGSGVAPSVAAGVVAGSFDEPSQPAKASVARASASTARQSQ